MKCASGAAKKDTTPKTAWKKTTGPVKLVSVNLTTKGAAPRFAMNVEGLATFQVYTVLSSGMSLKSERSM